MSDLRYVVSGNIYQTKDTSVIRKIVFQQQMLLEEIIEMMEDAGYSISPCVKYIYRLCLSRNEFYTIVNRIKKDEVLDDKVNWLTSWIKENIYECPKEYIMQMVTDLRNVSNITLPEERTEIQMEDKQLEKELRTICFQYDCVLSELLLMIRKIDSRYISMGSVIFELKLTEENIHDIQSYMLHHARESEQSKKQWLNKYLTEKEIDFFDMDLSQIVQAFSFDCKIDFSKIKEAFQSQEM